MDITKRRLAIPEVSWRCKGCPLFERNPDARAHIEFDSDGQTVPHLLLDWAAMGVWFYMVRLSSNIKVLGCLSSRRSRHCDLLSSR